MLFSRTWVFPLPSYRRIFVGVWLLRITFILSAGTSRLRIAKVVRVGRNFSLCPHRYDGRWTCVVDTFQRVTRSCLALLYGDLFNGSSHVAMQVLWWNRSALCYNLETLLLISNENEQCRFSIIIVDAMTSKA